MKEYLAIDVAHVNDGVVKLTKEQAAARIHNLETVDKKKGLYKVIGPLNFKAGERFGYLGDLPKRMASVALDMESEESDETLQSRIDQIIVAIDKLDLEAPGILDANDNPKVSAIREMTGFSVTASERDEAMRQIKEGTTENSRGILGRLFGKQ